MRTLDKTKLGYVWYVDNGNWLAGPYQKKPQKHGGGIPVRFKLSPDDGDTPTTKPTLTIKGYCGAMDGKKLWIDAEDGIVKIPIENKKDRWEFYCKNLKITVEEEN